VPTAPREAPYRFFFFGADCVEPAHLHVQRDKLWLHDPTFADTGGFPAKELGRIMAIVRDRKTFLQERWNDYCKGYG